jgi:hypothetical protein
MCVRGKQSRPVLSLSLSLTRLGYVSMRFSGSRCWWGRKCEKVMTSGRPPLLPLLLLLLLRVVASSSAVSMAQLGCCSPLSFAASSAAAVASSPMAWPTGKPSGHLHAV